jgi:hypothetical protein
MSKHNERSSQVSPVIANAVPEYISPEPITKRKMKHIPVICDFLKEAVAALITRNPDPFNERTSQGMPVKYEEN